MRLISHPVLCNYYVTYRCNAKCHFCDIWEKPSPYITLKDAEKNFIDLKKLGVKVIDFTGGEPLLHQQLPELLTLAKKYGFITTITTNGLLYPKKAHQLKGLIDMLHFSLDAFDKATHDKGRGVACYDKVLESIELAKSLGEKPDILFTVMNTNIDDISEVYEHITRPNHLILLLNPIFEYGEVGGGLSKTSIEKLSKWSNQKHIFLNDAFLTLRKDGGNHIENPICKAASTSIVISPKNSLILPCYHLGDQEFDINGELASLYQSKKIQAIIAQEGKLPECEGCAINCYMQPSFSVEINKYFWKALPSTLKYNYWKGTWKHLFNSKSTF
ncbi:radical SAM protein [Flammeovirga kamogawensis]|uniref:Radical SAM protein n=1 Tax=Flammeovirga kamogawensis TaxID=373891 RepID=A0ABX8GSU0_9BACT|nr:radical SAM protein [Flammeovirga kamogawensis]MBB6463384.1 MoaA/NifB/PqqE/SkfB family radical SAM enzyme [Flammeovirga kamogawensis]QWG06645.1 radical SAM protein [Flammeovirga kamogawensis]TRX68468.1 radical SAM protein [Flammeovirga kamogawensis]